MSLVAHAVDLMQSAKRFCVLTGAGVSKESGIPTFRDAQTGLWANYDPQQLASPSGFKSNPTLVWQWYDGRRQKLVEVKPNPGHYAIAELAQLVESLMVITQNVDGLHQMAGSQGVIELHGNITTFHCFDRFHEAVDVPIGLPEPPKCHCGSLLRPSVVWFGEALPERAFKDSALAAEQCDVMFVVGTSGLVYPAASLPSLAHGSGACIIEINREPTPLTELADLFIEQESGKALPEIIKRFKEQRKISPG